MNITDVSVQSDGVFLKTVFEMQESLMKKYIDIEGKNEIGLGLLKGIDIKDFNNIDSSKMQYVMKDFAWRITEEIMEAVEAFDNNEMLHAQEEMADSFHFLIELYILANISVEHIIEYAKDKNPINYYFLKASNEGDLIGNWYYPIVNFLSCIGRAMNCLKQKPWKQTEMFTDKIKFRRLLIESFEYWIYMAVIFGMNPNTVIEIYMKKHKVNEFRQRSQY